MYAPAGNTTGTAGLAHLATVWYNRRALTTLRKHTHFHRAGKNDDLPLQNGKTVQWFRPTEFGVNITATTEGSPGTSLEMATSTISATVSQFSDYITLSDFLVATDIVNTTQMATDRLSYRASLTVDTLIRNEIDANATAQTLIGDVLSAFDLAKTDAIFKGGDVQTMENGYFKCFSHPYVLYDLKNDPQAGGFQDLSKYIASLQQANIKTPDRGLIGHIHNCEIWETSNSLQTSGSPNQWRTYILGQEALGLVRLSGLGPKYISDPDKERFNVWTVKNDGQQIADIERKIAYGCAYKFIFAPKTLDANRMRKIDSPSSVVA